MTFWPRIPGLHQVIGSIYWVILFDFRYLCNFAPNKPNTFEEIFFVKPQTLEKCMSNIFAIHCHFVVLIAASSIVIDCKEVKLVESAHINQLFQRLNEICT